MFIQYNEDIVGKENTKFIEKKSVCTSTLFSEIFLCLLFPIPYYDCYIVTYSRKGIEVVYFLSEILTILMWFRVWFLIRTCFAWSVFADPYSRKLCRSYGFETRQTFTLKCYIKIRPNTTVFVLIVATITIFGHICKIAELPYFR